MRSSQIMRPKLRAGALHAKAVGALAPYKLHSVLGGSIGHGIGLSLHEEDWNSKRLQMEHWRKTVSIHCRSVPPTPKPAMH